jgi:hypothetical protein
MSTILTQTNGEIEKFKTKQIQMFEGLYVNQYEIIQKIIFYYNSKFISGDIDDEGDRKYFNNINKNPCKVCTKAVDFDTKNIRAITVGGGDPIKTWYLERDLKFWMRDQQFGKILNRLFREIPIFGTVVLKIIGGKPYFVDLRNFVIEQSAETLEDSSYIIEVHNYSIPEFRKVAKQMKWSDEKVNETLDKFREMKDVSHIKIYERYGEVCDENEKGEKSYNYKRVYIADVGVDQYDQYGNLTIAKTGVELS